MINVAKCALNIDNEKTYQSIFSTCFQDKWTHSVPYPLDPFYTATVDGAVVGFCQVHDTAPTMPCGAGSYLYNLAVAVPHRRQGVATALVAAVQQDHPRCYTHTSSVLGLLDRAGWRHVGVWREKYVEYCVGFAAENREIALIQFSKYDDEENLVYLN